jgi:P4 family phage/plasmid primase-like protien
MPAQGKPSAGSPAKKPKQARLKILVPGAQPTEIQPGVMVPKDWDDLAEHCQQCPGVAVLEVVNLPLWPDDARGTLLATVRDLDGKARLRIGKKEFDDPFEAVLTAMQGKPMAGLKQSIKAAIEAAGIFCAEMPGQAAKRINDRLAKIGAAKENHPSLVKRIKEMSDAGTSAGKSLDAGKLAELSLGALRAELEIDDDRPVLRYYQADFYLWNGRCWARQEDREFAARVMRFLQSQDLPKVTERTCKDVVAHLGALAFLDCWSEPMPVYVASESPLVIEHPNYVVFRNGVFDLGAFIKGDKPPALLEHDSRYFGEVVLPYDFDPAAKCPLWLATLKDILPKTAGDDRRRLVLQEFFGYTLLSDCRFNAMLILYGEGGNGRSTVTEPWEAMLGEENVSDVALEALGSEYRLWSLKGKLANFSGELQYLGKMHEGLVKRVVSGETIDANRKFKAPAKFRPFAKLVVNTNDLPQIQDTSDGTWDRLVTMPFEVRIRGTDKEDKQRVPKLKTELPGIFNWALKGLKRLLAQGHFTPCAKCQTFLNSHRIDSDTVRLFAAECCEEEEGWKTFSVPLYQFYNYYCTTTGRKPVAESEFGRRLKRLDWQKDRETDGARRLFYANRKLSATGLTHHDRAAEKHAYFGTITRYGTKNYP